MGTVGLRQSKFEVLVSIQSDRMSLKVGLVVIAMIAVSFAGANPGLKGSVFEGNKKCYKSYEEEDYDYTCCPEEYNDCPSDWVDCCPGYYCSTSHFKSCEKCPPGFDIPECKKWKCLKCKFV